MAGGGQLAFAGEPAPADAAGAILLGNPEGRAFRRKTRGTQHRQFAQARHGAGLAGGHNNLMTATAIFRSRLPASDLSSGGYNAASRDVGRVKMHGALPAWVSYGVYTIIIAAGVAIILALVWPRRD